MIERFARIVEDDLPDFCRPYCRKVTWIWSAFLLSNAIFVGALAFFGLGSFVTLALAPVLIIVAQSRVRRLAR